jgi:hypothetical protein
MTSSSVAPSVAVQAHGDDYSLSKPDDAAPAKPYEYEQYDHILMFSSLGLILSQVYYNVQSWQSQYRCHSESYPSRILARVATPLGLDVARMGPCRGAGSLPLPAACSVGPRALVHIAEPDAAAQHVARVVPDARLATRGHDRAARRLSRATGAIDYGAAQGCRRGILGGAGVCHSRWQRCV